MYLMERNRGVPDSKRIFDKAFEVILVTDFRSAHDAILGGLQSFFPIDLTPPRGRRCLR